MVLNVDLRQKILRSVSYDEGFNFFWPDGHYSGETATTLCFFLRDLQHVDMPSIRFHFERGDFQKVLRTTIGDEELAEKIDNIDKRSADENLQQQLVDIVQKRISLLKTAKQ